MFAFAMTMRARARTPSTSVFVASGYVRRNHAEGHGFEPRRVQWNFLPIRNALSRRGDQFDSGECTKKISTFSDFRLCPCLAGDPVIKLFSQLNPAHRGRAKFPGIVDLARITASSATAPAELKLTKNKAAA